MTIIRALLIATAVAGCASTPVPDATCDALRQYLPTWAENDTEDTLASAARFLDVYYGVCGETAP